MITEFEKGVEYDWKLDLGSCFSNALEFKAKADHASLIIPSVKSTLERPECTKLYCNGELANL